MASHSIDWLERHQAQGARVGEIDFMLVHPDEGILTIEVKGGGIARRHGAWVRKRPGGDWEPMKDPVKHVRDNQFASSAFSSERPSGPSSGRSWRTRSRVLSSKHQLALGPGADERIVIDRRDIEDLPAAIERVLAFHRGRATSAGRWARTVSRRWLTCSLRRWGCASRSGSS